MLYLYIRTGFIMVVADVDVDDSNWFWGIDLLQVINNIWENKLHFVSVYRTVRTWDVKSEKQHKSLFKPRSSHGKKVVPTCCTYSRDGKLIAAGCQDGTIQIWDRNISVSLPTHSYQPSQCVLGCKHRMSVLLWPWVTGQEAKVHQVTDQHSSIQSVWL